MKFAAFNAICPFELGDKFQGEDGKEHTITDIVAMHSMKTMAVNFAYELDNSGKLVEWRWSRRKGRCKVDRLTERVRKIREDPYGLIVCLAMDADDPEGICPKDNPAYEPEDRITGICETCPYCRTLEEIVKAIERGKQEP